MIITIVAHGRTTRDTAAVLAHLESREGQCSCVLLVDWSHEDHVPDVLAGMEFMRDGSRATIAFHHLTISPRCRLTFAQCEDVVGRIVEALGAEEHARVLWEHSEKPRVGAAVDQHLHLVLSHVGPDLRALDMGFSYTRLEAVARTIEFDLGETMTPSRQASSVAARLRVTGRDDVADAVLAGVSSQMPRSITSSRARARAERHGLLSPQRVSEMAQAAWAASDTREAFQSALAEAGLVVEPGRQARVWLVTQNGIVIGALDRLIRGSRVEVDARMRRPTMPRDPELSAKLDARETQMLETLDRLDAEVPAEPADLVRCRDKAAEARTIASDAFVAWSGAVARTKNLGPRPRGPIAFFSRESSRWGDRLLQSRLNAEMQHSQLLRSSARAERLQADLARRTKAYSLLKARSLEKTRPAREAAENALRGIRDARLCLADTPDVVAWKGLSKAVFRLRAQRALGRDGPQPEPSDQTGPGPP